MQLNSSKLLRNWNWTFGRLHRPHKDADNDKALEYRFERKKKKLNKEAKTGRRIQMYNIQVSDLIVGVKRSEGK